ncbi:Alkaline ceramidase 3 [Podochytrium sp. JEL0797]|nr:Alkaline ceramidase 3 [Podochytrium sp. JEL0797]
MTGYSYWPGGSAAKEGFWGPTTSSLDWCEENYVITEYIAEFWNSLSNVVFIGLAWFGMSTLKKIGANETRHYMAFASLIVVAVGSMLFHGTMWFHAQMLDEIPMIYNACIILFCLLQLFPESVRYKPLLTLFFACYSAAVTGIYLVYQNPRFHAISHGLLTGALILTCPFQIAHLKRRNAFCANRVAGIWQLYTYSIASYLMGVGVWSIDNNFCDLLRGLRVNFGTPVGFLFEFHVYWHLFSAVGGYGCILLMVYMRMVVLERKDVEVEWVMWRLFPVLKSRFGEEEKCE